MADVRQAGIGIHRVADEHGKTGCFERPGFMPISDAELPLVVRPSPAFHGDRDDAGTPMQNTL